MSSFLFAHFDYIHCHICRFFLLLFAILCVHLKLPEKKKGKHSTCLGQNTHNSYSVALFVLFLYFSLCFYCVVFALLNNSHTLRTKQKVFVYVCVDHKKIKKKIAYTHLFLFVSTAFNNSLFVDAHNSNNKNENLFDSFRFYGIAMSSSE